MHQAVTLGLVTNLLGHPLVGGHGAVAFHVARGDADDVAALLGRALADGGHCAAISAGGDGEAGLGQLLAQPAGLVIRLAIRGGRGTAEYSDHVGH